MYEGYLMSSTLEPRTLTSKYGAGDSGTHQQMSPRKRRVSDDGTLLDVCLADNTGPVLLNTKGPVMDAIVRMAGMTQKDDGRLLLQFQNVRVIALRRTDTYGEVLTPIKALHTIPSSVNDAGTMVIAVKTPMSPYNTTQLFTMPAFPIAVTKFWPVQNKLKAPFRSSFVGIIEDVGEEDITSTGKTKKVFSLVDDEGVWLSCCAMEDHAMSETLADGNKVFIYNGSARPALSAMPAALFLFTDTSLVLLESGCLHRVSKCTEIDL